jgi:hypothetical protein
MSQLHAYAEMPAHIATEPKAPLSFRVAVPFILLLSLALWAVLWKVGCWAFDLMSGMPGGWGHQTICSKSYAKRPGAGT